MSDTPNLMDSYLSEPRAKSKSASTEEMFQRLATEKQIQEVLLRLSGEFGFRFIEDRRINPEQTSADFILQFENYEARIDIQYEAETRPTLDKDKLARYCTLMEKNDLTEAIIVVWTTENLLSLALTLPRVKHLQMSTDAVSKAVDSAKPLDETITRFVESQTPRWSLPSEATPRASLFDTSSVFVREFESAVQSEAKRRFQIPEKQSAARTLGQRDVRQFEDLIRKATSGTDVKELEQQLLTIIRVKT